MRTVWRGTAAAVALCLVLVASRPGQAIAAQETGPWGCLTQICRSVTTVTVTIITTSAGFYGALCAADDTCRKQRLNDIHSAAQQAAGAVRDIYQNVKAEAQRVWNTIQSWWSGN